MSLEYAILGFLNYRPLSGYDLKKVFDNSVRHFWPADQSQIYRTLTKLAEQGYVEQEIVRGLDRPDRKEYRITPAGREALRAWLLNPLPAQDLRIAELIQVFFAGQLSDQQAVTLFERLAAARGPPSQPTTGYRSRPMRTRRPQACSANISSGS